MTSTRTWHRCDEACICPLDGKPLIYSPCWDRHACQDPGCANAKGLTDSWQRGFGVVDVEFVGGPYDGMRRHVGVGIDQTPAPIYQSVGEPWEPIRYHREVNRDATGPFWHYEYEDPQRFH